MNETNGPGAVVPVGWMRTIAGLYPDPSIYTPVVLERGEPILPEEAKEGDLFFWTTSHSAWTVSTCEKSEFITPALERRYEYAWLRPHAVPSPQPAPGSDAEPVFRCRKCGRLGSVGRCCSDDDHDREPMNDTARIITAPPQESDKGRENGEDISLDDLPAYIAALERQLAEARAEVEALREEVALTNEHEHQILQERNEARDELAATRAALLAYQEAEKAEPDAWVVETRGGNVIYWTSKERSIAEQVAASYDREAIPLYRHPPAPADVVTVPREEWEALRALFAAAGRAIHAASTGERATLEEINDAWAGVCSAQVALRSSAQAERGGAT